jgi:uncharacterized integral membrane protein
VLGGFDMKYRAMLVAGAVLFVVGPILGALHKSAAWASILFILGVVLLIFSIDKVKMPSLFGTGDKKGDDDVGTYQI